MPDFSERIAALSPAKKALLQQRMAGLRPNAGRNFIPKSHHTGTAPLSFAQERLWFLDQLSPGSVAYSMPNCLRLEGDLDVPALQRSMDEILRRHEVLRTRYTMTNGAPVQVIEPFVPLEMPLNDLSGLPEPERHAEAMRLCAVEAARPFDLTRDLMLRASLFRLGEQDYLLFLNRHHIASDGWSLGVFMKELQTLYAAFVEGKPSPLPELPVQYADFAIWQREWLQGEVLEKQLGWWRKQLDGAPLLLELPADRPRPVMPSDTGGFLSLELPETLTLTLSELSRREGVTMFMTLMAAFQVLLHRYTGCSQILVGSPIAGRNRTEIENLIGFFVNTLVFRGDLSGDPTFRTLLARTRETSMGAFANQDLPFEQLVKALSPERTTSHSPIFQVMFVLQQSRDPITLPGLRVTPMKLDNGASEFDLALSIEQSGASLRAEMQYRADLFDETTIRRMLGQYRILLEGIAANSDNTVSSLPLLSKAEQHQLLAEWNPVVAGEAGERCIHELVEAQAESAPGATALVHGRQELAYRELNKRANQLAHYIVKHGARPGAQVGICIERCPEMIIAMLGVLKAGAAYVPLDPAYPEERLKFIIRDAGLSLLLTLRKQSESLPRVDAPMLLLDDERDAIAREDGQNFATATNPGSLAYVIYTSGSTGQPKGVMIEHRALVNYIRSAVNHYKIRADDRILQFATINFDGSVEEIFCALTTGASLFLRTDEMLGFKPLAANCRAWRLSALMLPTAFWHEMVNWLSTENVRMPESVRLVVIGGESASAERAAMWKSRCPDIRLVNSYGPTEATVVATVWDLPAQFDRGTLAEVPIGKPFPHCKAYVLDQNLQLLPIGTIGELHVGGAALARGYLNQPERTAEKFIPNPFEPGGRLYKTGDLARWLPDGNLVFRGRTDDQFKIRGFRVEAGEIESLLRQHPSVSETAVAVREDLGGPKQLVAYVVLKGTGQFQAGDLRKSLQSKLPDYMIPSAFVAVPALPRTPNGKIDHRLLPKPADSNESEKYAGAKDELEAKLVKIWEKFLGRRPIGVRDNFFELGGHSLLAVSVFSEIEKKLGKNLPLAVLFQAPTIEQLAAFLRDQGWSPPWSPLVAIKPDGTNPPFFFIHGADGGILHFKPLISHVDPDQPCYGVQSPGLDGSSIAASTAEAFAKDYIREIRAIQPEGPYFLSGFSSGGIIAYEMAQQLGADQVGLLVVFDTGNPLIRPRRYTFRERCAMRRREITGLSPARAFWYLFKRFYGMIVAQTRKKWDQVQQAFYKLELKRGSGISYEYRHLHVRVANHAVYDNYRPKPYGGRLTIFRADSVEKGHEYDEYLGWNGLAAGGIEIVQFSALHGELFKEPLVRKVADELNRCVRKALAAYPAPGARSAEHI